MIHHSVLYLTQTFAVETSYAALTCYVKAHQHNSAIRIIQSSQITVTHEAQREEVRPVELRPLAVDAGKYITEYVLQCESAACTTPALQPRQR